MTSPPAVPGAQTSEGDRLLIGRLRADAAEWDPATIYGAQETRDLEREAADEIERLTAALSAEQAAREKAERERDEARFCWAGLNQQFQDNLEALESAEQSAREQIAELESLRKTNAMLAQNWTDTERLLAAARASQWQSVPPPPGQDTALPKTSEPHSPTAVAVALERAAGICDQRVKAMEQTNGWHSRGPYTMGAYNEAVCLALSIRALIPSPDTQQDHVAGASPARVDQIGG